MRFDNIQSLRLILYFQGRTAVSYDDFYSYIMNLSQTTFKGSDYHLLKHNCNNFSDQVSEFLTGRKIPSHITGLPQVLFGHIYISAFR